MNINIHLMWDNNDDYNKWLNTAYSENACATIASVDDSKGGLNLNISTTA